MKKATSSFKIYSFMYGELGLSGRHLIIYALIYSYTKGGGMCYASRRHLAEIAGISAKYVSATIKELVEKGLVTLVGVSDSQTNIYRADLDRVAHLTQELQVFTSKADEEDERNIGTDETRGTVTNVTDSYGKPIGSETMPKGAHTLSVTNVNESTVQKLGTNKNTELSRKEAISIPMEHSSLPGEHSSTPMEHSSHNTNRDNNRDTKKINKQTTSCTLTARERKRKYEEFLRGKTENEERIDHLRDRIDEAMASGNTLLEKSYKRSLERELLLAVKYETAETLGIESEVDEEFFENISFVGTDSLLIMSDKQWRYLEAWLGEDALEAYVLRLEDYLRSHPEASPHSHFETIKKWAKKDFALNMK